MVRHGESENNVLMAISQEAFAKHRKVDPSLSPKGEDQATATGQYFLPSAGNVVDFIVTSPVRRAMQTARPIASASGHPPRVWTDIFEVGGMWMDDAARPGMSRSDLEAEFPGYQAPPEVGEQGWYDVRQGIETEGMACARAQAVALRLRQMARDLPGGAQSMALVAHHDFLDLLCQALVIGRTRGCFPPTFSHYNCGITCVDVRADGHVNVRFLNSTAHLPPDMVNAKPLQKQP